MVKSHSREELETEFSDVYSEKSQLVTYKNRGLVVIGVEERVFFLSE